MQHLTASAGLYAAAEATNATGIVGLLGDALVATQWQIHGWLQLANQLLNFITSPSFLQELNAELNAVVDLVVRVVRDLPALYSAYLSEISALPPQQQILYLLNLPFLPLEVVATIAFLDWFYGLVQSGVFD